MLLKAVCKYYCGREKCSFQGLVGVSKVVVCTFFQGSRLCREVKNKKKKSNDRVRVGGYAILYGLILFLRTYGTHCDE